MKILGVLLFLVGMFIIAVPVIFRFSGPGVRWVELNKIPRSRIVASFVIGMLLASWGVHLMK